MDVQQILLIVLLCISGIAAVWLESSWMTLLVCPLISVMMIYTYVTAQKLR